MLYGLTFVGSSEVLRTTDLHPFWVVDQQAWIDAAQLKPGMTVLLVDGTTTKVESVTRKEETATVYNFSVDQLHTYFAGELGVLVHNCGGIYQFIDTATGKPYIGRTIDLGRRASQHFARIQPDTFQVLQRFAPGTTTLSMRIAEQKAINAAGGVGGLAKKINSIAPKYWNGYGI